MAKDLPDLCRLCVVEDGRIKANFTDNTILLLNSAGSAFTVVQPDGQQTRQLSEYALTRHSPLVAAVLEFRNMHLDKPYFCRPLARTLKSGFTLGYALHDVTWPSSAQEALAQGLLQRHPDGKIAISSEDGTAQVVVHFHRRRFAVCYPLLVEERPQEGKFEYIWHTQVFSFQSYPPRWEPAVRVAMDAAVGSLQEGEQVSAVGPDQQPQQHEVLLNDPQAGSQPQCGGMGMQRGTFALLASPAQPHAADNAYTPCAQGSTPQPATSAQRSTQLPTASDRSPTGYHEQFPAGSWWQESSLSLLPLDDVLLFEWTPDATYQLVPASGEIEVWVHHDESCLVSLRGGRFWAHFKDAGGPEQMYAASCVPDYAWSQASSAGRYPLGQLAAHALKLREHAASTLKLRSTGAGAPVSAGQRAERRARGPALVANPSDELFAVHSTVVLEESTVPGQGVFTAYEDGRVRICFEDRTILHLSASHEHCKVFLPDGKVATVSTANPVGVEAYVHVAQDFCAWAFKTPAERAEVLRGQARVRAELAASQRMAQVCEYGATHAVPSAVAQQLLRLPSPERRPEVPRGGTQGLYGGEGGPLGGLGGEGSAGGAPPDRDRMIQELLARNAQLLQRL